MLADVAIFLAAAIMAVPTAGTNRFSRCQAASRGPIDLRIVKKPVAAGVKPILQSRP